MTSSWDPGALCPDAIPFLRHGAAGVPASEFVDRVLSHAEREAIVKGYAGKAGFMQSQINK